MKLSSEDYYYEGSYLVFTEEYHKKRGYCCKNSCRHCPYKHKKMKPKAIFNWSGGKDSALALYTIQQENTYEVSTLLTSVNEKFQRISMHGVRVELLKEQANQLNLPVHTLMLPEQPSMKEYETLMFETMSNFKRQNINHSIFGDIFLEDLRTYREQKLDQLNLKAIFPLWKRNTTELMNEFINLGFKTIVVCVDAQKLDQSFSGRVIDKEFIKDLPKNVDPCGENGEFHTFCFDGPIFNHPINFEIGETVFREYITPQSTNDQTNDQCTLPSETKMGFWFTDLIPKNNNQ